MKKKKNDERATWGLEQNSHRHFLSRIDRILFYFFFFYVRKTRQKII